MPVFVGLFNSYFERKKCFCLQPIQEHTVLPSEIKQARSRFKSLISLFAWYKGFPQKACLKVHV